MPAHNEVKSQAHDDDANKNAAPSSKPASHEASGIAAAPYKDKAPEPKPAPKEATAPYKETATNPEPAPYKALSPAHDEAPYKERSPNSEAAPYKEAPSSESVPYEASPKPYKEAPASESAPVKNEAAPHMDASPRPESVPYEASPLPHDEAPYKDPAPATEPVPAKNEAAPYQDVTLHPEPVPYEASLSIEPSNKAAASYRETNNPTRADITTAYSDAAAVKTTPAVINLDFHFKSKKKHIEHIVIINFKPWLKPILFMYFVFYFDPLMPINKMNLQSTRVPYKKITHQGNSI